VRRATSLFVPASVALAVGILLATLPPPVSAGSEPPSPLATAYNTQRKLVRAADGTLFVAITANVSNTPQVRVLSSTSGGPWAELPPPSGTGNAADRAALAIDSRGLLHLVWTEVSAQDRQVFYARFSGSEWTPPIQLSMSPGYAGFPSLAVDDRNRVHVVWYGFDGTFYQVYYRRLDPGGWTSERALTNQNVDATNPAIALGPEGHVHVVWFREHTAMGYLEVAYLRLEGDTVAEIRSLSTADVDSVDPTIAVAASGQVHVAWHAFVGSTDTIQYAERDMNWSSPQIVTPASISALHPSLAIDHLSRVYLVWEASDGRIYGQVRNGSWSAPLALGSQGVARYPSTRWSQYNNPPCGADGRIDVVWTEESPGGIRIARGFMGDPTPCPLNPTSDARWLPAAVLGLVLATIALWVALVRPRRPRRTR